VGQRGAERKKSIQKTRAVKHGSANYLNASAPPARHGGDEIDPLEAKKSRNGLHRIMGKGEVEEETRMGYS